MHSSELDFNIPQTTTGTPGLCPMESMPGTWRPKQDHGRVTVRREVIYFNQMYIPWGLLGIIHYTEYKYA